MAQAEYSKPPPRTMEYRMAISANGTKTCRVAAKHTRGNRKKIIGLAGTFL
jgi:hypothetical protein